jgi:hypothetical protein
VNADIIPTAITANAITVIVVFDSINVKVEKPIYKSFPFVLDCPLLNVRHISKAYIYILVFDSNKHFI